MPQLFSALSPHGLKVSSGCDGGGSYNIFLHWASQSLEMALKKLFYLSLIKENVCETCGTLENAIYYEDTNMFGYA